MGKTRPLAAAAGAKRHCPREARPGLRLRLWPPLRCRRGPTRAKGSGARRGGVTGPARLEVAAAAGRGPRGPSLAWPGRPSLPSWDRVCTPGCGAGAARGLQRPDRPGAGQWGRSPGAGARVWERAPPPSHAPAARSLRGPGGAPRPALHPAAAAAAAGRCCGHPAGGEARRNLIPFLPGKRSSSLGLGGSLFLA